MTTIQKKAWWILAVSALGSLGLAKLIERQRSNQNTGPEPCSDYDEELLQA